MGKLLITTRRAYISNILLPLTCVYLMVGNGAGEVPARSCQSTWAIPKKQGSNIGAMLFEDLR
ncbi:hypothetical protein OOU_Y34scaffold00721g1 [Pyricularia oryzae Y34]|uniref:Uncharacterized protein n=1 Tax=Pyricularia oryzae (strain Y34) TaxID=1143189 RepID=A0AA97NRW8_PYRO3|nr:hypothetical protein OOU_Y34scaffold00721g1 [Pyricularia oryzae Y34]